MAKSVQDGVDTTPGPGAIASRLTRDARSWVERIWASVAERGRSFAPIPAENIAMLERAKMLASALLTERGEASGAAVAQELLHAVNSLPKSQRHLFLNFLAEGFQADAEDLADACRAFLHAPSPATAAAVATAAEPPRQDLLRRMNMAEGGTAALVALRAEIPAISKDFPALPALDSDLRHLLSSWFNRGFLELRQIDWQTPAAILEKLIAYEAVHEIEGWEDLRRRLGPDRRCFAFFHPALPGEPLIFVEVALVTGLAGSVSELLERDTDEAAQRQRAEVADTAIFYSISNCQAGLRGISFGNFLIKQVVEILRDEMPGLKNFATLSPIPGFRGWLENGLAQDSLPEISLGVAEREAMTGAADGADDLRAVLRSALDSEMWDQRDGLARKMRPILLKLCAHYLAAAPETMQRAGDPVARFHLGNGARLERLNWMGNPGKRGMRESLGMMVNYLYDPAMIEANHEAYVRVGKVARSPEIDNLLTVNRIPRKRAILAA